jgi:hypothetical protein
MAEGQTPVEIFCIYAHEDEMWLRKLETHLSVLKRQGFISLWHDRLITPGTDWTRELDAHLETTSVILLLVSADFFASDYCYGVEMKRALERHEAGVARVLPILVRPSDWTSAPFAHLQALPTDARPMATWRNKDTALADVTAGIRRVIVEELPLLTASAPRAALPAIWNIPYPRNPFFLGRDDLLAYLYSQLQEGRVMALSGLGGIGKTQIAVEYAYRFHQKYQGVFWIRAESLESLIASYITFAKLLNLPERDASEQTVIIQAVKVWLQSHRDWLLIFDSVEDLKLLPDFLPLLSQGDTLLTTRAWAMQRLAQRVEVGPLPAKQGALFLLQRTGQLSLDKPLEQVEPDDLEIAIQLSEQMGGLPLALDQVGGYLEATRMSMEEYLSIYQVHRRELHQQFRGWDYPQSVATTWLLSFARVEQRDPAAAELLRLCAFLTSDAISENVLVQNAAHLGPTLERILTDPFLRAQAVDTLLAFSLINRDSKKKALSMHPLVQAVLQDGMDESEKDRWTACALRIASTIGSQPVLYHSCFISYSSRDEMLARRLHADLQTNGVRCWFAPEDMKIGDKIRPRIDEAIHVQDKLLLLLSEHAIVSEWVEIEVESALEKEARQQREVLFPIRLDDTVMQTTHAWAATLRRTRHIGDFTQWTDSKAYQRAFDRLLRDLKA